MQSKFTSSAYLLAQLASVSGERSTWSAYPCLIWPFGSDRKRGYGRLRYESEARPVHRVAYEIENGFVVPAERDISWYCGERLCFRPSHLFIVPTQFELLQKMLSQINDDLSLPWSTYPCLEWTYTKSNKGYGMLSADKTCTVHRIAWTLSGKALSSDQDLLHCCDNPPCFRPSHLHIGTHLQNMRERDHRKRRRYALTMDQVWEIRRLIADGAVQSRIAEKFFVSASIISEIKLDKIYQDYKHIPNTEAK